MVTLLDDGRRVAHFWPREAAFDDMIFVDAETSVLQRTDRFICIQVDNGSALYEITEHDPYALRTWAVLRQASLNGELV
jgi:hypothetical protein